MSLESLTERYAAGIDLVQQAVAGMTAAQLRERPVPGKWSTLEVLSHLADFEVIGVDRIMAVIAEDGPALPGRDERQFIARLAYEQRDPDEQLQLITLCRRHVTRILRTLTDADLSRCGIHSEAGQLTLEMLLNRVITHVEHHMKFIHQKRRALGMAAPA